MHIGITWPGIKRSVQWLKILGGVMILLPCDFPQIGPLIPKSITADEINACIKSSNLWRYVKKLQLTTNMRVALLNDLLKISPRNCWLSVMVAFLSTNRADWYNFLEIFALLFHRKMSSSTKCSQTSFLTTKITNGWVNEQFWQLRTKMWLT